MPGMIRTGPQGAATGRNQIIAYGIGSMESAVESGRLDAYAYLQKPCELEHLIEVVEAARRDRPLVMEKHEIPHIEKGSRWKWLWGSHNSRPGMLMLGALIFLVLTFMPTPDRLDHLLSFKKKSMITAR
jgi:sodium-dependent dicarboxylate transporter 2/3/5